MKRYWPLLVIVAVLAAVVDVSQYAESSNQRCQESTGQTRTATVAEDGDAKASKDAKDACKPPIWSRYFTWPEGVGAWGVILTLIVVAWQSIETARSAKAVENQARLMRRQTKATKASVKTSQDTLVLTQRPRIVVRNLYFTESKGIGGAKDPPHGIQEGSLAGGQFYIINVGGTKAEVCEMVCETHIDRKTLPMKPPYEGKVGNQTHFSLHPGESTTRTFARDIALTRQESSDLSYAVDGLRYFYVLGWIGYKDDLGIYRITRFCRRLDGGSFVAVDNPDYESAD